jgi:hypothetical protein
VTQEALDQYNRLAESLGWIITDPDPTLEIWYARALQALHQISDLRAVISRMEGRKEAKP